jgi:hypothetical protein
LKAMLCKALWSVTISVFIWPAN